MKRIIVLSIALFLILVFPFAAGEEAGTPVSRDENSMEGKDQPDETAVRPMYIRDDQPIEEIARSVIGYPWSGEINCVKDCVDHGTYMEIILGSDRSDGTVDDAAAILADKNTGRVICYRRSDYRMPEFLNENDIFGFNDDRETSMAWSSLKNTWLDWGEQTFAQLTGDDFRVLRRGMITGLLCMP